MKQLKDLTTLQLENLLKSKARRMGITFIYWELLKELEKRYLNENNQLKAI